MVLLDDVVEIFALPHARSAPEFAVSLHVYDCPWISGVLVDREGARVHDMRLHERPAKEPLRRHRISPSRQQKIDRPPAAVNRPIDRSSAPSREHRFRPPASSHCSSARCGRTRFSSSSAWPGSNGRSSCGPPRHTVDEHELEIAVTDREHQTPRNGQQNHFRCELTPLKQLPPRSIALPRPIPTGGRHTRNGATRETCNRTRHRAVVGP